MKYTDVFVQIFTNPWIYPPVKGTPVGFFGMRASSVGWVNNRNRSERFPKMGNDKL